MKQLVPGTILTLLATVCLALCTSPAEGKVRRRLTIRSDPPGAVVYIDDQRVGVTPVSTSFTFYGTRKVRLIKDGYETITVKRTIRAPWYQWTPLDFFAENLVLTELRDERLLHFKLLPQRIRTDQELLQRGQQLRRRAGQRIVVPPPAPATTGGPASGVDPLPTIRSRPLSPAP